MAVSERRVRAPQCEGMEAHFSATDPDPRYELTRIPWLKRLVKSRSFQFFFILPNQIIFWIVIFTGLIGAMNPTRNFSTVITWYIWFMAVFVLMVGIGRGWCLMCPFGGFGEWVQRLTPWGRRANSIGVGARWPRSLSQIGIITSAVVFVGLTWAEEFFNIAGPGVPAYTSYMVLGIISLALITFLVTERRTFCRYLCPLTSLIGTVGSTGMATGFRTKDRNVCLSCPTKDCIRGSEDGYGCPWYEWPGSATSNAFCGLCTECIKNCPYDNIGLFVQPPLTSVTEPSRRRWDVSVAAAILLGLVLFQQLNALPFYGPLDDTLNKWMHFPGYPNPVDYLALIAVAGGIVMLWAWLLKVALQRRQPAALIVRSGGQASGEMVQVAGGSASSPNASSNASSGSRAGYFAWFMPVMYGLLPLMAADYLARQLPRFWDHALRIVPAISDPFSVGWNLFGTAHSKLYGVHLLSPSGIVVSQVVVVLLGTAATWYTTDRSLKRDVAAFTARPLWLRVLGALFVLALGAAMIALYIAMGGAE
jgi:NosR/NirI family transcriptional regulator, nitrous oxide reductase regulator